MNIYQHFRVEEHSFIDHVMEWKDGVIAQYSPKLTDFLDPREQQILSSVIGQDSEVNYVCFGGSEYVERKRALIFPSFYEPREEDFQIALYAINYPQKFVKIEHPQVLGSLMGIGLKRGKFGDILIKDGIVQVVIASEVANFVLMNLESIGKSKVSLEPLQLKEIIQVQEQWIEEICTVSSLRLDVIVAEAFNLSRTKSLPYIQGGHTKVNWKHVEEISFECKEGDMISVRGNGRVKILQIEGKTKRDKWKLLIGRIK
ncbi:RNA-binding protein [Bacillus salitolerans]|uniref:RNA-binding protein n=1 Tax=Bacillus salitolerans TaxID=1437434 RepID=A0ABW4LLE3_9BACI